tara:strand:- start:848 stop:979 length:132 start_codon:yes stop_codon:yes gene_type:complete
MDKIFTYLQHKQHIQIINFLDKEIESLDSLIDLHSNIASDKVE